MNEHKKNIIILEIIIFFLISIIPSSCLISHIINCFYDSVNETSRQERQAATAAIEEFKKKTADMVRENLWKFVDKIIFSILLTIKKPQDRKAKGLICLTAKRQLV
ncbi:MAG: hypothetical protein FWC01_08490 [Treponema sp.]|nr:hypothetical protein [Treponema sp.]MCL2237966.1 hypothetical protein [Treponema sp.]